MSRLTPTERNSFTSQKLAELDRMSDRRMGDALEPPEQAGQAPRKPEETAALRAKCVGRWANMRTPQLRALVNCTSWSQGVSFAPESDYTAAEQNFIAWGWKANVGRYFHQECERILAEAGELKVALDADLALAAGSKTALLKAILKAR